MVASRVHNPADLPQLVVKKKIAEGSRHALCLQGAKTCSSPDIEVTDDGYDVHFAEAVLGIQEMFNNFSMQDAEQLDDLVSFHILCIYIF